jgi:predicted transcriptional regulator
LKRKKKVKRTLKDKAYFYRPAVSRSQAASHAIGDLIERMFGGSAENLVMGLLQTKHLTVAKLAELNKLIAKDIPDDQN